jgi:hypothetical protein
MEDVLAVYRRPYDPERPVVCMDEMSRQLLQQVRAPIEMRRGAPYREDHHYRRNGTASLFTFFEPLAAWRTVMTHRRRTKVDWARCIRSLLVDHYPMAETVVLVMDNLNIHHLSSLYEAFGPAEARGLAARLEIHFTPEHGSWLNVAEIEQGVLARQRPCPTSPRAPDSNAGGDAGDDDRVGRSAKSKRRVGRLAVYRRRRSHQAEAALPED